jgi:undecaprenyl-diphosphatase
MLRQSGRTAVRILFSIAVWTAFMVGLGLLVTRVLQHSWPFTAEEGVNRDLAKDRTPTWNTVSKIFSYLGGTPTVIAATVIAALIMWLVLRSLREPLFLIAAVSAQGLVFLLTTLAIDRTRPPVPKLDFSPPTSSFPSGHTGAAVALYAGIALVITVHTRRKSLITAWWVLLLAVPVCVAVARLYRGMHYPSDVTASFLNGAVCLAVCARALLYKAEAKARPGIHRAKALLPDGPR